MYTDIIYRKPGVPVLGASSGSNTSISKLTCRDLEL